MRYDFFSTRPVANPPRNFKLITLGMIAVCLLLVYLCWDMSGLVGRQLSPAAVGAATFLTVQLVRQWWADRHRAAGKA